MSAENNKRFEALAKRIDRLLVWSVSITMGYRFPGCCCLENTAIDESGYRENMAVGAIPGILW
uniref:Uncharacterized protein n=1 Tax=Candidatus Kentrum sp. FW TaxID=2126338 RepID=A0A450ST85_9GAMM|nr:MAG: hypothetical protein BECKFW1821A_GA0114235_101031 [Candidatus Kentron sp. FW]VFJ57135.1 MAG: hypothetical protein BECKFW1821B_GA0114236_10326 [Candidatus Kentron sp. FW]